MVDATIGFCVGLRKEVFEFCGPIGVVCSVVVRFQYCLLHVIQEKQLREIEFRLAIVAKSL